MPLSLGTRIGNYEVMGAIGAGGMGEVYRARDGRLNRDVAIKVLPASFASDPDRLQRFEREAQVLASLNHPNIATIHGFEDIEADGGRALVMELVEGPTLADRIEAGPIAIDEALAIARQLIDALDVAHSQGIIHRDLKPANIKLRPDGGVKILDFGLAKAFTPDSGIGPPDSQNSPTLTARATQMGVILGTAAYMAPEQARGNPVDRRADIWAFGCVLYEMVSGKRVFAGDDLTETLAAVVKDNPSLEHAPPGFRRLLRRCLEKDPRKRLRDVADAWDLLETESSSTEATGAKSTRTSWTSRLAWTAGALVLGVGGTLIASNLWRPAPESSVTRFSVLPPANIALYADSTSTAISPDGQWLAFVTGNATFSNAAAAELYVRRVDSVKAIRLAGTEGGILPFWSADSRQIGFFANGKMMRIAVDGGRIETICDAKDGRGGAWNSDDVIVFAPSNAGGLMRVTAGGGTPEPVTTLDATRGETGHRFPAFLPDGRHFLYAALPARAGKFDVVVGSLDGSTREQLLTAESTPVFAPPGYLLYTRNDRLVAQRFDAVQRKLSGEPVSLDDEPGAVGNQYFAGRAVAASANGSLAYLANLPTNANLRWFNQAGLETGTVSIPRGEYRQSILAPDGRSAVLTRRVSPTATDLWIADLERGGATRLTDAPGTNQFAVWSPRGDRIAFASSREGPNDIYLKAVSSGTAEEAILKSQALFKYPLSWSVDGKYVVYYDLSPATNYDLWILPMTGDDRTPKLYLRTPASESAATISPDGKWMAYLSDESGRPEVYVQPFPTAGRKFKVTTTGASAVWWRKDGKQLFVASMESVDLLLSDVAPGSEFSASVPRVVGHLPKGVVALDVTTDLQRILALVTEGGNVNLSVTVVQNWLKGLSR